MRASTEFDIQTRVDPSDSNCLPTAMSERPLLMIPGPVEVSPQVLRAFSTPPPGHGQPFVVKALGSTLGRMREVWRAGEGAQPFLVAGSGTLAMDIAAVNLLDPGDEALLVDTGYFADRMRLVLEHRGVKVQVVTSPPGERPELEEVEAALDASRAKALFATHVDTSTGVFVDPAGLAALARSRGVLSVFDGVCATGAETFEMSEWGADVCFTASQKAMGLPPGLALFVAGPGAMEASRARSTPCPLYLDWNVWLPIMETHEAGRMSYFATPATNLVVAAEVALGEILSDRLNGLDGVAARVERHARTGRAMRAAWAHLGLGMVPASDAHCANTLSAVRYPAGVDASLVGRIVERGVIVAAGLHPQIHDQYFRVGHMGYVTTRPDLLRRTIRAVGDALGASGCPVDTAGAVDAAMDELDYRAVAV